MRWIRFLIIGIVSGIIIFSIYGICKTEVNTNMKERKIALPKPKLTGSISIEEVLNKRRSIRKFLNSLISVSELSQLLWSAQGITTEDGRRTSPSAGATYPLEIYISVKNIENLKEGLYKYAPDAHSLLLIDENNRSVQIAEATYQPQMVKGAAAIFIITSVLNRTTSVYGERGIRYAYMEAGHSAQNLSLMGVALNIGLVLVGAFDDNKLSDALSLKKDEIPLYIIPVGKTDKYKK